MIVSVLANVAEMERENIKERQREGITIAKAKGVYHGRKQGTELTSEQLLEKYKSVVKELNQGESIRRTAKLCEVSPATVQKIKKLYRSQIQESLQCLDIGNIRYPRHRWCLRVKPAIQKVITYRLFMSGIRGNFEFATVFTF